MEKEPGHLRTTWERARELEDWILVVIDMMIKAQCQFGIDHADESTAWNEQPTHWYSTSDNRDRMQNLPDRLCITRDNTKTARSFLKHQSAIREVDQSCPLLGTGFEGRESNCHSSVAQPTFRPGTAFGKTFT